MATVGSADYSAAYVFTMRDAHRRPYQSIRTPALTRHLVFRRQPSDFEDEDGWIQRLESIVISIFSSLVALSHPDGFIPRISNLRQPPRSGEDAIDLFRSTYRRTDRTEPLFEKTPFSDGGRYETAVIHAIWRGLTITVRIEVFDEFFCLTTTLELRPTRAARLTLSQQEERRPFTNAFDEVITAILARKSQDTNTDKWTAAIDNSVESLSSTVWTLFNEDVLNEAFDPIRRQALFVETGWYPAHRLSSSDEIIADFRGFLLSLDVLGEGVNAIRKTGPDTEAEELAKRSARVFAGRGAFGGSGAADWADALFPLLIHAESVELKRGSDRRQHTRSPFEIAEYTWSLFDNRRALYGSGFGPQTKASVGGSPLQYVLLFAHDDHRSAGRIVNRIQTLGTMRLAALLDFDRVIERDRVITQLDAELNSIDETRHAGHLAQRHFDALHALQSQLESLATTVRDQGHGLGNNADRLASLSDLCLEAQKDATRLREQARDRLEHLHKQPGIAHSEKLPRDWIRLGSAFDDVERDIHRAYGIATEALQRGVSVAELTPSTRRSLQRIKADCSRVLRSLAVLRRGSTVNRYQNTVLNHIGRALYSMSDRLRFGIEYRADRSRYYRDRFEELSRAMYIHEVPGYQKYDDFVRHRLDRAYSLIASVALRFNSVQHRFTETRKRIAAERNYSNTSSIERMQKFAEYVLFFILIPYYLGGLVQPFIEKFTPLEPKSAKLAAVGTAVFLATIFYLLLVYWWEGRDEKQLGVTEMSRRRKDISGKTAPW